MKTKLFLLSAMFAGTLTSCIKDDATTVVHNYTDDEYAVLTQKLNLPVEVDEYGIQLPQTLGGFKTFINSKEATLGRVLFYDKRLSSNLEVNCASCHKAELAFTDGEQFSPGVTTERTSRNTLALGSFPSFTAYYGSGGTRMFWDNRAGSVMEQSTETMKNPVEMGNTDLAELADELLQDKMYQILFEKAFPNNPWQSNEDKMLIALQSFVSSIGCVNSRFDKAWADANGDLTTSYPSFTQEENRGKQLYMANCSSCHILTGSSFFGGTSTPVIAANNGLDMDYADEGIFKISSLPSDKGVFKVPLLRNIELTAPYMHDGRFATLEAVVDHYSDGIQNHPNLHSELRDANTGQAKKMNLNESDKQALVAFLKTLTDKESLAHVRYSDPFKG
ncbi:MAG: c-type cytochrome [Saprospiraceae bacterium]|nr:c-type cytochrome [Saprospiraceae bacterium]